MIYSYRWLQDYVELPKKIENIKKFQSLLSERIAEVEKILEINTHLQEISFVEILAIEEHPEAQKLRLLHIHHNSELKKIVCGDLTLKVGDVVPYAFLGVKLPELVIEPKKIRGILSEGMLCSEQELGLSQNSEGVLVVDKKYLFKTVEEYSGKMSDYLLEVDNKSITHRPDLWGHYGFARELSLLGYKFHELPQEVFKPLLSDHIKITKNSHCKAFFAVNIENIQIQESQGLVQQRLQSIGQKTINNLVDLSNYLMFDLGLPSHFFDKDKIEFPLSVRKALHQEVLETLEGDKKRLEESISVIADKKNVLSLAGIKGGKYSGISSLTKNVFFEVANWDASNIRKSATILSLRTEASSRYEKSQDSMMCLHVIAKAIKFLTEWYPQSKISLEYAFLEEQSPVVLNFKKEFFESVLGISIEEKELISVFQKLGFKIKNATIEVPSWRSTKDITREIDLIEEFGRHFGYRNIQSQDMIAPIYPEKRPHKYLFVEQLKDFFVLKANAYELLTSSFVSSERASELGLKNGVKTLNPTSKESEFLRENLLVSLLKSVELNVKFESQFSLFEIGRVYEKDHEKDEVAICFYSKEEKQFLRAVEVLEDFQKYFSLKLSLVASNPEDFYNQEIALFFQGKQCGFLRSFSRTFLRSKKIEGYLSYFSFNLESSFELKTKVFQEFSTTQTLLVLLEDSFFL
jgi:phenylalanyl-tRNA synthetase beta chain